MKLSKSLITYLLLFIISILLLFYLTMTMRNSEVIKDNIEIKNKAEKIKGEANDIIRKLHLMDLGIRGYAILPQQNYIGNYDSAIFYLEYSFAFLERELSAQQFPMDDFYTFKDSVYAYIDYGELMIRHLQKGERAQFNDIFEHDYGYDTYLEYLKFNHQVQVFENGIFDDANNKYKRALSSNTNVFTLILFLVIPTLFYTAYHSNRTFKVSERLRISEQKNNEILSEQNIKLEKLVKERTEEIATQNEEIIAQNEELSEANHLIEQQNKTINNRNVYLKKEVDKQTQKLLAANTELVQRMKKMEQYAFIVSHNLRSPVAQILGLSHLLIQTENPLESKDLLEYVAKATTKLDIVLNDLNQILLIENNPDKETVSINLVACLEEVINSLDDQINATKTQITQNFEVENMVSVRPYIYSIFYNLLSNAIKYHKPERIPEINISSSSTNDEISIIVSDNGLGIDMEKYGKDMFSLYRRFHTHVDGRGLGLYLTKVQIESLGGTIKVESKLGEGTSFLITLPFKKNITQQ